MGCIVEQEQFSSGKSLVVQWLGLHTSAAGGTGSISGQGTKIPHALRCSQKKRAATAAKLFQSCPTLCDPIDSSPPGSTILGIL